MGPVSYTHLGNRDGDFEGISLPRRAGRHKGLGPEWESGVKMGFIQEKTKPGRVAKRPRKKRRGKEGALQNTPAQKDEARDPKGVSKPRLFA